MSLKTTLKALFVLSNIIFVVSHSEAECNVRSSGCSQFETTAAATLDEKDMSNSTIEDSSTSAVDTEATKLNSTETTPSESAGLFDFNTTTETAATNSTTDSNIAFPANNSYFGISAVDPIIDFAVVNSNIDSFATNLAKGGDSPSESFPYYPPPSEPQRAESYNSYGQEKTGSSQEHYGYERRLGGWSSYFDRRFYMIPGSYQRYGRYENLYVRADYPVTADIKQRYIGTLEVKLKVINWIDWTYTVDVGTGYIRQRTFLSRTNNYGPREIMDVEYALSHILERVDQIEIGFQDEIKFTITSERTSISFR